VHELNGSEMQKYIKSDQCAQLINQHILSHSSSSSSSSSLSVSERVGVMRGWMKGLLHHLLHEREWSDDDVSNFSSLVNDIHTNCTHSPIFRLHGHRVMSCESECVVL